ncbi:DNA-directed RNA polymerase III subunit RPC7 isoform X4 [Coturnix japonica]|uniref:DNA-directed RNA polymerase III subunit RPC7 isoform X4 n=1 Tax=Coturnix japonica TaxID=93934 RepID=UPI0013A5CF62|nr:DNA-directed RNA polymerase III subunit RPC7 isoform X4 [Coturnix japonica]
MAGSGRGRGRASFTFNIEAIGFSKGAVLPDVVCKPPPLFPSTENKPVPLKTGEDEDYMLALKQEFRGAMKRLPYFLAVEEEHEAIERYSKRYMDDEKEHSAWTPAGAKPKKAKNSEPKSNLDVLKKIEELEKKDDEEEKSDDEKDRTKDKEGEDDEEAEEPEEYDEEEHEEVFYLVFCFHQIRSQSLNSVLAVSQRNVPSFSEAEGEPQGNALFN